GLGNENITATDTTITVAQANTLHGFTSGVVTSTINATGATGAQLTSLAGFGDKVGSTITNLTLTITDATSDQSRSQQFAEVTDSLAQVLFDNVGTNSVTITGNADADWVDLRGFDTTNVNFTINGLAGNNVIYSGDGNDTITTTTGNDYVEVGGGLDTVDTGDGNDTIAVRSLNSVDGSSYTGGIGDDTIKVYGTNDLTNSTLSGIENIELLPGSPSVVTLTIDQVKNLSKVTGTSGNSELVVVQNAAQVTVTGGGTLVGDANGNDTLAFTYNGTAYTATIPANTAIGDGGTALNALIDAATTGGGVALGADKVTATYNGANLILQVDDPLTAGVATTLTAVTYTDATAGAAASNTTTTTDVDLSSITFSGLQKLTTSSGVTATVTVAQMTNISEVASDNNSLGLNLNGVALAADLDISAASLQSATINITNMAGFTLTTSSAQIEAARVDKSTGANGIVKVLMTADSDLDDAFLTTLARGTDGASEINTNHDLRLVLDSSASPKVDFDLTTETAATFTTAVNSVEVKADNTLIISGTHAGSETFLGSGTIQAKGNGTEDYTSATIGSDLTLEIDGTTTVALTAAQATGRSIITSGTGPAVLNIGTATAATTYDFGEIAADNLTATLTYTTGGTLASGTASNWGNIDNVVVAAGQTLTLNAGQASGKNIDGAGSGSIVVVLDDSAGLDFSLITVDAVAGGTFTASVTADVTLASDANLGTLVTTVASGKTLTLTAAQAAGKTFNGAGTVAITALQADLDADLSNVGTAATSTFTGIQSAITQNDTIVIDYNGGGNTTITIGNVGGDNTTKLAAVNTALVAQYGAGAPVATWSGTDLVITAGAANYTLVSGNFVDVDNVGAATTPTNAAGTIVTAALATASASAVNFVGNLGKAAVTTSGDGTLNLDGATSGSATIALNSTSTLVGTAAVLDNTNVTGTGTVTVSALHTTPAANLSGIVAGTTSTVSATSDGNVSVTGNLSTMDTIAVTGTSGTVTFAAAATLASGNTITVGANSAISLTAADADLVTAITGGGTTTVTALESTLAANLSTVTSTTVNADLAMTADRTLTADLTSVDTLAISGAFTATVNSTNVGTGTYTVAAGSALSMTAAKIDALAAATGTATATYNAGNVSLANNDTVA
ncbi:hypothetical protein N9X90_08220, partial [Alphaproteobacteria bacterium]|nr:hypothetical protein [Alphaproteobacteria bacterium]